MNIDWSDRIKALEDAGLTLKAIGEAVGLTSSGVSEIKRGATKAPRGDAALKLDALHRLKCTPAATKAASA